MISPQMQQLHQIYRDYVAASVGPDGNPITIEQARKNVAGLYVLGTDPEGVTHREVDAGGIRAILTTPPAPADDRVIEFFHGGGYVLGEPEHYDAFCGHLAVAVGCRVLSVGYRLAPENPHPAAVTDAVAVYRWMLEEGHHPLHIALCGDSAGGGLAITTLLGIRDAGLPQPAGSVAISPWVDMEFSSDSMKTKTGDLMVQYPGALVLGDAFIAGGDPRDPLASPIYGDFTGIAPIYVQVGGEERLLDESHRVVEKARADGAQASVDVFDGLHHIFQIAAGFAPESDDAVRRIAAFLRPLLGR
jgi:acetyl esterase/lipase